MTVQRATTSRYASQQQRVRRCRSARQGALSVAPLDVLRSGDGSQNPVTRVRRVASDLNRFADELDVGPDLDPAVLRYWHAQLLEISAELERSSSPTRDRA
jgi:hypothetical protein